jgi:hypothetical protein
MNRIAFAPVLALLFASSTVWAADDKTPEEYGVDPAAVTGKVVYRDGSKSKFLEDHNVQSGVDAALGFEEVQGDGTFRLQGFGQSGEKQGFVVADYNLLGVFSLSLDFDHWTEYYNNRDGGSRPGAFPFSNDSSIFYGDGIASTDWLTAGGDVEIEIGKIVHDVYGDFHYRNVDGDQTLLKGGAVDGIFDAGGVSPPNLSTGPVNFGFTGRKDVDYDAYLASGGLRSDALGINWQTDVGFQYHEIEGRTDEIGYDSFQTGGSLSNVDTYTEDTELKIWKADIAGSRHINHSLYVFGAGFFSYERSDPEPDQLVFERVTGLRTQTRTTTGSKVERYTPGGSLGLIWRPLTRVVVRADTRARGYIQDGDLDETLAESQLVSGIGVNGNIVNDVDREAVVSTTNVSADWKATSRLTVKGDARYQYRLDDVDATASTSVAGERPEVEDAEQEMHRFKVGPTVRYRMRRGRSVEGGYEFSYADVEQDIDTLQNQYNVGDYEQFRHRVFAKASGRIMDGVRGEVRAHYIYETREMDGAIGADALGATLNPSSSAEVESEAWNIAPVLYWMPDAKWSVHGRYSIGQTTIEADSGGTFEYEVMTHSLSTGVTFRPDDAWSVSGGYSFYLNDDDVDNNGHNASLSGDFQLMDNLSLNGGLRYFGYNADSSPDDYDAVVITMGVRGTF